MSLASLLDDAAEALRRAGFAEPRREVQQIWTGLGGPEARRRLLDRREPVPPHEAERLRAAVQRRMAGEPLPYVTGWAGFRRLTLRIDARALIPRPETEGLVELVLERVKGGRVADLGTGSGCIALSLADEGRCAAVLAVEQSGSALALARENRRLTNLPVEFVRGDLSEALGPASLDAVVSNPPYLTEAEYQALDASVRSWEPRAALSSGPDGLTATRRVLVDGGRVLRPGGLLALEVDAARAAHAARLAAQQGWDDVHVHHDLFGRARYLLARRSIES